MAVVCSTGSWPLLCDFRVSLNAATKSAILKVRQCLAQFGYRMRTISGRNLSELSTTELENIVCKMSLDDLSRVLYRCDAEERDDGKGFGTYNIPGHGTLPYCGIQGWCQTVLLKGHHHRGWCWSLESAEFPGIATPLLGPIPFLQCPGFWLGRVELVHAVISNGVWCQCGLVAKRWPWINARLRSTHVWPASCGRLREALHTLHVNINWVSCQT